MAVAKKVVKKRKELKNVDKGQVHIQSSFNNTIVTVTDANGNAITQCSAGALGYKGSRKSTPFAAQQASETAAKAAMERSIRKRSGTRQRVRYPRSRQRRFRGNSYFRRIPHPPQRMPSAETP